MKQVINDLQPKDVVQLADLNQRTRFYACYFASNRRSSELAILTRIDGQWGFQYFTEEPSKRLYFSGRSAKVAIANALENNRNVFITEDFYEFVSFINKR